jgi:hypothetical protein
MFQNLRWKNFVPVSDQRHLVAGYGKMQTEQYSVAVATKGGKLIVVRVAAGAPRKLSLIWGKCHQPFNPSEIIQRAVKKSKLLPGHFSLPGRRSS